MSEWVSLGAFAAGLLVGRKKGARTIRVPPRIVYVPLDREAKSPPSFEEIKRQVFETATKNYGSVDEAVLETVAKSVWEYSRLVWLRDYYIYRINNVSKAFSERRISRGVFNMLVRYYKRRLLAVELRIRELGGGR